MPAENDLLPCPLCGGEAIFNLAGWAGEVVECSDCGLNIVRLFDSKPNVRELWNRRADIKECARQQPTTP